MPFPTVPVVDNFNRANSDPLDGNWTNATATGFWENPLALASNQVTVSGANPYGGAQWDTQYGDDVEVAAIISLASYIEIGLTVASQVADAAPDGYGFGFEAGDTVYIYRIDGGVYTELDSIGVSAFDGIGCEKVGSLLKLYTRSGGTWGLRLSVTDSTYASTQYILMGLYPSDVMDDFSAGAYGGGGGWGPLLGQRRNRLVA